MYGKSLMASQSLLDVTVIVADELINAVKYEQGACAHEHDVFTQESATMRFQGIRKTTML